MYNKPKQIICYGGPYANSMLSLPQAVRAQQRGSLCRIGTGYIPKPKPLQRLLPPLPQSKPDFCRRIEARSAKLDASDWPRDG